MRYVLSRADGVVALSTAEAGFQKRNYRLEDAAHTTIHNGIDANIYQYRRENIAGRGRPWQLLFAGQLIPLKGVDILVNALALLPDDIELTLVYQNNSMERELRELASRLGLKERVRVRGKRTPAELA